MTEWVSNRKRSQQQEKRAAKRVGGSLQPGSGSGWKHRNDVKSSRFLYEMKRTDKKQITIKLADLEGLRRNATVAGRIPVMHIEIGNRRWYLIEESDFHVLVDEE